MKHTAVFVFVAVATTAIGSTIAFAESGSVGRRSKAGIYLLEDTISGGTRYISFSRAGHRCLALQYSDKAFEGNAVFETCRV